MRLSLRLARGLEAEGIPILGTSPEAIDAAEDRGRFEALVRELGIAQPQNGTARTLDQALGVAERVGIRRAAHHRDHRTLYADRLERALDHLQGR